LAKPLVQLPKLLFKISNVERYGEIVVEQQFLPSFDVAKYSCSTSQIKTFAQLN